MKKCINVLLLFSLLAILATQQVMVAVAQEPPSIVDARQMTFFEQMKSQLALYDITGFWVLKVHPADQLQLLLAESPLYIEVYVLDVESANQSSVDIQTGKVVNIIQVYRPTEQVISQLSEIPNTHFYVSRYSPSIGMTVEKQMLEQIAKIPSVYCIRVIPSMSTSFDEPLKTNSFTLH